jgi:hypothetical protein
LGNLILSRERIYAGIYHRKKKPCIAGLERGLFL